MEKGRNNCDEIQRASRKVTNITLLPYKTPILHGAIQINNEYNKNVNDGIDYKKLCQDLNKYVNAQKKCVQEVTASQKRTFVTKQWKDIIQGLVQTYNAKNIKKICYYEGDQETTKKKHVLNIHDVFRKFCIEKKTRLQNKSDMDFLKCNEYLSWITEKKRGLQALDPNYENIREYQEYFDIHDNCNYPWLLRGTPDITCRVTTKTKTEKTDSEGENLKDTHKNAPILTQSSSSNKKEVTPAAVQPSSKGGMDPVTANSPNPAQDKTPIKSTSDSHDNTNTQQDTNMVILQGTPVSPSTAVSMSHPDYKIQINQSNYDNLLGNLFGYKIPHDVHHSINRKDLKINNDYPTDIKGEAIRSSIEKSYIYIPSQLRKQRFLPHFGKQGYIPQITRSEPFPVSIPYSQPPPITFSRAINYNPITKSIKYHTPLLREYPPFPIITSGTKEIETVLIQPATPDASYFRSPFMIYTLIILTIVAIITIFYLLSKYTPFGLLFGKKGKKQRLKRHLKTNKLPEEVPQFDTKDSYSINNMSYENNTHYNKGTKSHIKIQKSIINKNISLPKRKKKKHKAIIDIHMEMLNECKNDEWEFNKNDFLEICLEEFIKEQNKIYTSSEHTNLIMKSISTKNTKGDKVVLWDKWAKGYTHIWEYFKRENTFKILQNQWKEEEKAYYDKIEKHNTNFNENEKIPLIQTKKDIWKKWITKQAILMDQYKEEQWFKSLVEELENVSDEYKKGKIKDDIFVENIKELENKQNKEELYKSDKHIFLIKVLIQILTMVIEECIKEENPEQTQVLLDNLINKLNKEKREKIEPENIYEENMNHI
ncbi:STP1 protein [Plasmodium ovale curtisi]|uniref:STP1 protein n=1 Tax=Plasmodium ovale curtisi TaxID=864141 RepID=A0A1A8XFV2_PLAOA|nr:STP1 protein [Plasmodium ovale curtisi]